MKISFRKAVFPGRRSDDNHSTRLWALFIFELWLRTRSIDVVQTFDFYTNVFGLTAAALARVPLRMGARRETAGHRTAAQRWLERRAFQLAHVIVANSEAGPKGIDS